MEAYALMRTLGALAIVLGILAGALWIVRRYDIRLPGRTGSGGGTRRLEVVERTSLDGRRSIALLRRDGREHLILLAPEGNLVLETAIVRDEIDHAADAARMEAQRQAMEASKAEAEALRESFFAMVDKARNEVKGSIEAAHPVLKQVGERVQPALRQVRSRLAGRTDPPSSAHPVPSAQPEPSALPPIEPSTPSPKRSARTSQPRKRAQARTRTPRVAGEARG